MSEWWIGNEKIGNEGKRFQEQSISIGLIKGTDSLKIK